MRYAGILISLLLPGYFVALALYHQGLLSTEVLSTVIQSRKMVFEPLPFEMLLLLFVFQLIREAGMRVPGSIGQAIGVIGGLILGQAAVAANLASSVMLIIVALSGLGNFCVPDYSTQIAASYFRIAFVIAAWLGGLLGLAAALVGVYGVPCKHEIVRRSVPCAFCTENALETAVRYSRKTRNASQSGGLHEYARRYAAQTGRKIMKKFLKRCFKCVDKRMSPNQGFAVKRKFKNRLSKTVFGRGL